MYTIITHDIKHDVNVCHKQTVNNIQCCNTWHLAVVPVYYCCQDVCRVDLLATQYNRRKPTLSPPPDRIVTFSHRMTITKVITSSLVHWRCGYTLWSTNRRRSATRITRRGCVGHTWRCMQMRRSQRWRRGLWWYCWGGREVVHLCALPGAVGVCWLDSSLSCCWCHSVVCYTPVLLPSAGLPRWSPAPKRQVSLDRTTSAPRTAQNTSLADLSKWSSNQLLCDIHSHCLY